MKFDLDLMSKGYITRFESLFCCVFGLFYFLFITIFIFYSKLLHSYDYHFLKNNLKCTCSTNSLGGINTYTCTYMQAQASLAVPTMLEHCVLYNAAYTI